MHYLNIRIQLVASTYQSLRRSALWLAYTIPNLNVFSWAKMLFHGEELNQSFLTALKDIWSNQGNKS